MANPVQVMRIPRSDEQGSFVLIARLHSDSKIALNIELSATESENQYDLKCK